MEINGQGTKIQKRSVSQKKENINLVNAKPNVLFQKPPLAKYDFKTNKYASY
jgi:hypothetical protein